jgi:hypothetical protein
MENQNNTGIEFVIPQSTQRTNLFTALMKFQCECQTIPKLKSGYGYKYAELSKTMEIVKPLLLKHGIGFTQFLHGTNKITTMIFHGESGETIESMFEMPNSEPSKQMNIFQLDGSRFTYYKRYQLLSILGVFTDDDLDVDSRTPKQPQTDSKPASKTKKPKLDDQRFINAIKSVQNNEYTIDEIKNMCDLTPEQIQSLESLNN